MLALFTVLTAARRGGNGLPVILALLLLILSGPAAVDAGWGRTGDMTTSRRGHTATLLPNGLVLVAGGYDGSSVLSSAELYDPVARQWYPTGSMTKPRRNHTATLLPNGQVLVAGGRTYYSYDSSTELYDPTTGIWSPTGDMTVCRPGHTATLLLNGQVLAVGGGNPFYSVFSSAELYDPATGQWSPTGSMTTRRCGHMAALLSNGKVLVAGGYYNEPLPYYGPINSAELYDPVTGKWTCTDPMTARRCWLAATWLADGQALVVGGVEGAATSASAEVYDAVARKWSAAGSMAAPRAGQTCTLLSNGQILVAGGSTYILDTSFGNIASAELFDPITVTWSAAGSMATARSGHTATLLPNGLVLVAGGATGYSILSSAELYCLTNRKPR